MNGVAGRAIPECRPSDLPRRVFGLETEFGCLVHDDSAGTPERIADTVKNYVFQQARLGVLDLHARDFTFEPAYSGGFLLNGGRLYVDAVGDHEEYATPECRSLRDLVAQTRAGHLFLQDALAALGLIGRVSFHNNSVDHFGGHTFGCHENYLVRLTEDFFSDQVGLLLPFLATRQIFAGVGRVGGHRLNGRDFSRDVTRHSGHEVDYIWVHHIYAVENDPGVEFQLSQRSDHILKAVASKVRFNRAIINPKWDSAYSFGDSHRLHLLFGEANMSQWATAMKVGATCLVLDLMEAGLAPESVRVADPVSTLRSVSRDPTWKWPVRRADGGTIGAVDLQRLYLEQAQRAFSGRDPETDWVLHEWDYALTGLETDPYLLDDRVDWVAKRRLLESYGSAEGVSWADDVMFSLDLEYHNLDPGSGLSDLLLESGQLLELVDRASVRAAMDSPPAGTRAQGRATAVRLLLERGIRRYVVDWNGVYLEGDRSLDLRNPLRPCRAEAEALFPNLAAPVA